MSNGPTFVTLIDQTSQPFLSANIDDLPQRLRPLSVGTKDLASFLTATILVRPRKVGPFATDLTPFDDFLVVVLSLFLLLLLEAILTTVLLRSPDGRVKTLDFSIKQLVDFIYGFRFGYIKRSIEVHDKGRLGKLGKNVVLTASALVLFTLSLEVAILYLSRPHQIPVFTNRASFQLVDVLNPSWDEVSKHANTSLSSPCAQFSFQGVNQGANQISGCLTTNLGPLSSPRFELVDTDVDVNITTDVHEFGAEHRITIGADSAIYTARGFFELDKGGRRMMRKKSEYFDRDSQIGVLHKQIIAFLFTQYARDTLDDRLHLEYLNRLEIDFQTQNGGAVDIIQLKDGSRFRREQSTRHTTTLRGMVPRGAAAFHFAHIVLKASTGVGITDFGLPDLMMESGNSGHGRGVMWTETLRPLNWLSLSICVSLAVALVVMLRVLWKPVSIGSLAGIYFSSLIDDDFMPKVLFGAPANESVGGDGRLGGQTEGDELGRAESKGRDDVSNESSRKQKDKSRLAKYGKLLSGSARKVQSKVGSAIGLKFKSQASPDRDIVILL